MTQFQSTKSIEDSEKTETTKTDSAAATAKTIPHHSSPTKATRFTSKACLTIIKDVSPSLHLGLPSRAPPGPEGQS